MIKRKDRQPDASGSRGRSGGRVRKKARSPDAGVRERPLDHGLAAHRIELEVQNEELRAARTRAEQVAARFTELFDRSPLGYAALDATGVIHAINLIAARLLAHERDSLVGRRLGLFVAGRDRAAFQEFLASLHRQQGGGATIEVALAAPEEALPPEAPAYVRLTACQTPATAEILLCVEDVTERREADERLREADRRKGEFLATLAHELRTPLAAIVTATHILEHDPGSSAASRAHRIVRRQAEHIIRLVDDLLDVSRIERGKLVLRRSRVDLRELVLRVAEDYRGLLEDHGISFQVVTPDACVWADADGTRITQVVGNLLGNASKFTRRGDEVLLSLSEAGDVAEIRVKDTGAGIDPALLPRIFGAFVQGERTAARSAGGLGVGLAVVKALTELHAGTVRAESAGAGRGAEFVIRLPVEATTGAPKAEAGDRP
jgi:signal transduction histidine kinase